MDVGEEGLHGRQEAGGRGQGEGRVETVTEIIIFKFTQALKLST